jgi:hypothetical protein
MTKLYSWKKTIIKIQDPDPLIQKIRSRYQELPNGYLYHTEYFYKYVRTKMI